MRSTFLLLHGLVHRSLPYTIKCLRRHVIAPLERLGPVELFYHSWDVAEVRNPRAGEADTVLDASVIKELLPEAKGLIEPQEEYIRTMDWERLSRRNPMRHCTSGEEAAALSVSFHSPLLGEDRPEVGPYLGAVADRRVLLPYGCRSSMLGVD